MLAISIVIITILIIILLIVTRNKEELYRSGTETIFGFPNGVHCIQKKSCSHEWISIYRTQSETDWTNKIMEMKNNGKVFVKF